jgi:ubiquinone/menaquinone biosynthesis C-methylase UbiE
MARAVLLGQGEALRDDAVARLRLEHGSDVLDLACGPGTNLPRLERAVGPAGRVIALDYSGRMLERVRQRAAGHGWRNIETVPADAAHMELPAGSLGGALCTLGLSAMPEPELAIRNVHRSLEPGARFAVLDAKLAEGAWRVLNPLLRAVFVPTTNWNTSVDLIAALRDTFGTVAGRKLNRGTAFLAVAEKAASG